MSLVPKVNQVLIPAKNLGNMSEIPCDLIRDIFTAHNNYRQVKEIEETKREYIRRNSEVEIIKIRENVKLLNAYFEHSFRERKEQFDKLYSILNRGIDEKNDQCISAALTGIVNLIQESPIKQAASVMHQIEQRKVGEIIDI